MGTSDLPDPEKKPVKMMGEWMDVAAPTQTFQHCVVIKFEPSGKLYKVLYLKLSLQAGHRHQIVTVFAPAKKAASQIEAKIEQ